MNILSILLIIAMAATSLTMVYGIIHMLRENKKQEGVASNELMRWRILFQSVALIILGLLLFLNYK